MSGGQPAATHYLFLNRFHISRQFFDPVSSPTKCPKCGRTFEPGDFFCAGCGENFDNQSSPFQKLELADEEDAAIAGPRTCHRCGKEYSAEVAVCIDCGVDLVTGKMLETKTDRFNSVEEEEAEPGPLYRLMMFFAEYFPGFFFPRVLLASLLVAGLGAAVFGLCVFIFLLGAMLTAFPIGAAGFILYAQAIAWMLTGQFAFLSENLSEMEGKRLTLFLSILFLPLGAGYLWLNLHQH